MNHSTIILFHFLIINTIVNPVSKHLAKLTVVGILIQICAWFTTYCMHALHIMVVQPDSIHFQAVNL